jgi:hypothetical protein
LASVQCLLWPEFILVMRQIIHYFRAAPDVYESATAGMNATQGEFMCVYSAFFSPFACWCASVNNACGCRSADSFLVLGGLLSKDIGVINSAILPTPSPVSSKVTFMIFDSQS